MIAIKNERGITVIALVVTIVITLIIAATTIYVGTENIDYSKMVKFVSYMQAIQKKVDLISEYDNYTLYGEEVTADSTQISKLSQILNLNLDAIDTSKLRYFNEEKIASDLEIDGIEDEIIVDFETREVISLNGIKYDGEIYYTQYNLPGGQILNSYEETGREVSIGEIYENIDGLNATFTINDIGITNGSLYFGKEYTKDDDTKIKWQMITNYTTMGQNVTTPNVTETGTYYFKLVDNVTGNDNIGNDETYPSMDLRLTNSPKAKEDIEIELDENENIIYNYSDLSAFENWAYGTDTSNGNIYVWVPRFAYETENTENIEFLRGNSDITTSGGYITDDWTVPSVFTTTDDELTGVWIKVDSINQEELDIIEILDGVIY